MENFFINIASFIKSWLVALGISGGATDNTMVLVSFVGILVFVLINVLYLVYLERKVAGYFQERLGPNRVGPKGLLQTTADIIKLLGKEDIIPSGADKLIFKAAAYAIFVPSMLLFIVVPFGRDMVAVDLNMGIFYMLAISSTTTIFILMAGWGSNNKYSLLGGMRAVAQMVSYEIPLVFSILGVVMLTGSLQMSQIVEAQEGIWYVVLQPIAFLIFFIAGTAELNRAPFDLPEGEQELVAGFHTEYTGARFALFFLAEYTNLLSISAIGVTLFLGGWHGPWLPGWIWFFIKLYAMVFLFMWIRWTYPRVRIDHMMHFNWKVLLPLSLVNIVVTGIGIKAYQMFQMMGW